jgi:hypothetical protein
MFTLPPEFKAAMTFLITQGIKSIFAMFKVQISGWGSVAVASFVGAVLFFADSIVGALQPDQQSAVTMVVTLVMVILSAFGIHYTYAGLKPAGK